MVRNSFFFNCFILFVLFQDIFAAQLKQTFDIKSNVNSYFNFDQFDESLGNLRSIAILFCLQITDGQLILDNDGTSRATGDLQFGARGSISSTDVVLLNSSYMPTLENVFAVNEQTFNLAADNGDGLSVFDSSSPDGLLCIGIPQMGVQFGFIDKAFWSMGTKGFLGSGTFDINYSVMQLVDYGSIRLISYAVNPVETEGYITLIYNYQPTPEVGTILFFAIGTSFLKLRKGLYNKQLR